MVDKSDIAEMIAPKVGVAAPARAPVKSSEDQQREALLSRIAAEINELQSGPQSDDIRDAIRQLQGLSNQVRLGTIPVASAASRVSAVSNKADAQAREAYAKDSLELIKAIIFTEQVEQYYQDLSVVARARVDLVHNLLCKKGPLSHDEQVTVISNLALPEEQIGTKLGKDTAKTLLEMNPEAMAELQANPEGAKTGHIIVEKNRKDIKHIIEAQKDPQIKKHLKEGAIFACPNAATVGKMGQCHTAAAAKEFAEDAIATFKAEGAKHYADFLSATTTNAETREILEKNGGFKGAINRMKEMSGSEARLAAAERYANGDTTGATDEIKADAAALRAILAVGSSRQLDLIREIASKQKEQGIEKLTQRERDAVNPEISQERRGELLAEIQYERAMAAYGGGKSVSGTGGEEAQADTRTLAATDATKKFFTNIAVSAVKTSDKKYPNNPQGILSATPDDMQAMSRDAAKGVVETAFAKAGTAVGLGLDVITNVGTTDKKVTDKISHDAGLGVKNTLTHYGVGAETAQAVGHAVTTVLKVGADTKNEFIQAAAETKKDAIQAATELKNDAAQVAGNMWDSAAATFGQKTLGNQIEKNLEAINKNATFVAVTDGNGHKIFNADAKGGISKEELLKALAKHGITDLNQLDKNGDGLSQGELIGAMNKIMKEERAAGLAEKMKTDVAKLIPKIGEVKFSQAEKNLFGGADGKIDLADRDKILAVLKREGVDLSKFDKDKNGIDVKELGEAMHAAATHANANAKKPEAKVQGH